ncbi:hypothetical protein AVEN_155535-1 [Araneus ventricosus]|uniref:Uncharacterized protein n=1 Tax=Araneus ventricosus TaxID=182803 RepID=A0A4Y2SIW2_ARAVE|nr:hypothetical protein AVEN_155535-1 [Araneus ventricosus]
MIKFGHLSGTADHEANPSASPKTSLNHSIGSSDGRCGQGQGRNQHELMTRAYWNSSFMESYSFQSPARRRFRFSPLGRESTLIPSM